VPFGKPGAGLHITVLIIKDQETLDSGTGDQ